MPCYMKYGKINGDVQASQYKDWISLDSLSFGVTRNLTQGGGSGLNREAGKASVGDVQVTKKLDQASVLLFQEGWKGAATDCEIQFCTVQKDTLQPYLTYKLFDCMVSGFQTSAGGDERPYETLFLNFM